MANFSSKIRETSFEMTPREKIKYKDISDAIKLDEATKNGGIELTITGYVIVDIHNEGSRDRIDYPNYVYVAEDGNKYVSGSESLWRSYEDIRNELVENGDYDPIPLRFYRVPSKNYAGKDYLTCSMI